MKRALGSRLVRLESDHEMAVDRRGPAIEAARTVPERPRQDIDESPDDLIGQIRELQTCTLKILRRAEAAGRTDTALKGMREVRCNMELLARLTGQLDRPAEQHHNGHRYPRPNRSIQKRGRIADRRYRGHALTIACVRETESGLSSVSGGVDVDHASDRFQPPRRSTSSAMAVRVQLLRDSA